MWGQWFRIERKRCIDVHVERWFVLNRTTIEWTDWTVNPIKLELPNGRRVNACAKVSAGCAHCYAESITQRWWPKEETAAGRGFPGYRLPLFARGKVVLIDEELQALRRLDARIATGRADASENKVFWGDMTDLFGDWVPFAMLDRCVAVMWLTPNLIHQVLTKRPERMAKYFNRREFAQDLTRALLALQQERYSKPVRPFDSALAYVQRELRDAGGVLPNVWLGTSVEDQKAADQRIPDLLQCPAAVRFLSCEPLLGAVDINNPQPWGDHGKLYPLGLSKGRSRIHWVIAGGESGPGARPMHPDWVRGLRDQCQAAGVPFFFKQWGAWVPATREHGITGHVMPETGEKATWIGWDGRTQNPSSDGLTEPVMAIARVGKKAAGRELDGRSWDELQLHGAGGEPPAVVVGAASDDDDRYMFMAGLVCAVRRAALVRDVPVLRPVYEDETYRVFAFIAPDNNVMLDKAVFYCLHNNDDWYGPLGTLICDIKRWTSGAIGLQVEWIWVQEDHRRQGIGRLLWRTAEKVLGDRLEHNPVTDEGELFAQSLEREDETDG